MAHAQRMYGLDGEGAWDGGNIAFALRRSDRLDEDRFDVPPLVSGCGRYTLMADVRLDDRAGLAAALDIRNGESAVMSDTRLVLRAWEKWQLGLFGHVYGDFALAVWDSCERQLTLARDALGAKPLHFHHGNGFVAFASMAKGLHALPDVPIEPDEAALAGLLALIPESGSGTWFRHVWRVEPGHYVQFGQQGMVSRRHWNPDRNQPVPADFEAQVEGFSELLDRAVAARLRGAGKRVGSHLSAGLDSAAVTATAARLMAEQGGQVTAFTAAPRRGTDLPGKPGRIEDESRLATATARLYPNIDHRVVRSGGHDLAGPLDQAFLLFERPVLNICNLGWTNRINDEARQLGLAVMLVGNAGNMSFSYDGMTLPGELLMRGDIGGLVREGRALVRSGRMRWKGYFARALGQFVPDTLWRVAGRSWGRVTGLGDYSALSESAAVQYDIVARADAAGHDLGYRAESDAFAQRLRVLRRFDPGNYNKGMLAGWGLDVRDPTADRRLVEYCLALPTGAFLADGLPRRLARVGLADRLPLDVIGERAKGYQAADWFEDLTNSRHALCDEVRRLRHVKGAADLLDLDRLDAALENLPTEGWERPEVEREYRLKLLRGISTGHFLRKASRTNA